MRTLSHAAPAEYAWMSAPDDRRAPHQREFSRIDAGEGLRAFLLDPCPVTNVEFEAFIRATDYVTTAERGMPGRESGSWVVVAGSGAEEKERDTLTWVPGASWRAPAGRGSGIDGLEHFPVVHVSWLDAVAYCAWSGNRLPSRPEWEAAASDDVPSRPDVDSSAGRSNQAVGLGGCNCFGLFDMVGFTWEWTSSQAPHVGSLEAVRQLRKYGRNRPLQGFLAPARRAIRGGYRVGIEPSTSSGPSKSYASETATSSHLTLRCARSCD